MRLCIYYKEIYLRFGINKFYFRIFNKYNYSFFLFYYESRIIHKILKGHGGTAQRLTKKAKVLGSIFNRGNELLSLPPSEKNKAWRWIL